MRPRKNKYGNIKVEFDGFKFDSKKEARRYLYLKSLQETGEISALQLQPKFKLIIPGIGPIKIKSKTRSTTATYSADFKYLKDGVEVIEDVKSPATANDKTFKLKRGIVEAIFQIEILIV